MICIKISVATGDESDLYCSFHSRLITWIQLTHTRLKLPLCQNTTLESTCNLLIFSQYWYQHYEDFLRGWHCWLYWPQASTCTAQVCTFPLQDVALGCSPCGRGQMGPCSQGWGIRQRGMLSYPRSLSVIPHCSPSALLARYRADLAARGC